MPFETRTLQGCLSLILSDWKHVTGNDAAALPGRPERGFAKAQAAISYEQYQYLAWAVRQALVVSADDEAILVRTAAFFGVDRKPASRAIGGLDMQGTGGTIVPDKFRWFRADGKLYEAVGEQTLLLGDEFTVRAVEGGADSNCDAGVELYSVEPLTGLHSPLPVTATKIAGGRDQETIEELRSRLLFRMRNPPGGGKASDYKRWALEVPGVTRAWALDLYPKIGYVTVLFVRDGDGPNNLIFPSAAHIAEVQAYLSAKKPGGIAGVVADAPADVPLIVEVTLTPNTAAAQAAVKQSIRDMLYLRSEPKADAWELPKSWVAEAISNAPGEEDNVMTQPALNVSLSPLELLYYDDVLNPITFL